MRSLRFAAMVALVLQTLPSVAREPLLDIPAIGVNAWERGGCMATADYALLGSNGVRLFRTGFNEEEAAGIDDTVFRAAQANVQIAPILHSYVAPPTTEQQLASFTAFAASMVQRYGPNGNFWYTGGVRRTDIPYLPVRAWEVWNEPNLAGNWGGSPNPSQYHTLLARTRDAVTAVDHGAVIVFAGLALRGTNANTNGGITFLQQVLAVPGAATRFEAIGAHS
jgi:hypothetical protein